MFFFEFGLCKMGPWSSCAWGLETWFTSGSTSHSPTAHPQEQVHSCASLPLGVPAQPHSRSHHCRGGKLGTHALQPIEEGHCGSHPAQMTAPQGIWQVAGQRKAASWWAQASVISRQVRAQELKDLGEFSHQPWFGGDRLMKKGRCLTQLPRTPP